MSSVWRDDSGHFHQPYCNGKCYEYVYLGASETPICIPSGENHFFFNCADIIPGNKKAYQDLVKQVEQLQIDPSSKTKADNKSTATV